MRSALYSAGKGGVRHVKDGRQPFALEGDKQRRRHPREAVRLAATVSGAGLSEIPVWIHNVSRDGMLLAFAERPDRGRFRFGTPIRVTIGPGPDEAVPLLALRAQIRWIFAYGVGVKVSSADSGAMKALRTVVSDRLRDAAAADAAPEDAPD